MIDIHSHVLPGVDDGVVDLEESLTMLKNYEAAGVSAVIATSHVAPKRGYANTRQQLEKTLNRLKTAAQQHHINVELYLGAEVDNHPNLKQVLKDAPSLNDSGVVLIDFGMKQADIAEVCYELSLLDYTVILAHPERYFYIKMDTIRALHKQGVLMQVSAPHLIGHGSKKAQTLAKKMLKEKLIDFVATDAHRARFAPGDMLKKAYRRVQKKTSTLYAEAIFKENAKEKLFGGTRT